MNDLFTGVDQPDENTLRDSLTAKWKEKFPDAPEELLKSKVDSDLYVKTLERQKDEMRNDLIAKDKEIQARANLEDIIDRMNQKNSEVIPPPLKPEEKPTQIDFEKLFDERFNQKKTAEREERNFLEVQKKLSERYGNNAGQVLVEQANTMGLTKEDVNTLAKKSPEAFFRMMGLNQQQNDLFMAPPRQGVRNDNYMPKTEKRSWSFYQDMKKKDPNKYWSPQTQLQMHKDSERLGDAFEDGDYNT